MSQTHYDPEIWLESSVRAVKDYVVNSTNPDVYDVVMEFPGPRLDSEKMPLRKTVIHFEIDDLQERAVGLGDGVFAMNYSESENTVNQQYATRHVINFDVGIWASEASGGTTSRMRAREILHSLFGVPHSINPFRVLTDGGDGGIQIMRYQGGRFDTDRINDLLVYRMMGGELELQVFSRTPLSDTPAPAIDSITQDPGLTIIG